jgi:hypothetical protein
MSRSLNGVHQTIVVTVLSFLLDTVIVHTGGRLAVRGGPDSRYGNYAASPLSATPTVLREARGPGPVGDRANRGAQRRLLRDCDHLLVLDIRVPTTEFDNLWRAIVHQWPAYLGWVTSFLTIGGIWLAHHGVSRRLR